MRPESRATRLIEDITINRNTYRDENHSVFRPNHSMESPTRATIRITRDPASPEAERDLAQGFMDGPQQPRSAQLQHARLPSDASSIVVPRMDQSMSMLLQEKSYEDGFDGTSLYSANDGSPPPSPTMVLGKMTARATSETKPGNQRFFSSSLSPQAGSIHTPARRRTAASANMETSPTTTTADYSVAPGSPGSLVLRPEDERHLDELLSFMGNDDAAL